MPKVNSRSDFEFRLGIAKNTELQLHSEVELMYVLEGEASVTVDELNTELNKQDIIVINPGHSHSVRNNGNGIIFIISMPSSLFFDSDNGRRSIFLCNTALAANKNDTWLRSLLNEILRRYLVNPRADLEQTSLCYRLASYLVRYYSCAEEATRDDLISDDKRIRNALLYMYENYSQPLTLTDLSEQLHLSSGYLSRYLKKNLGVNFKEFLTKIRITCASDDLTYTEKSVLRVALDNGFANLNIFNSAFKAKHNLTPSEFRNKTKQEAQLQEKAHTEMEARLIEKFKSTYQQASELTSNIIVDDEIYITDGEKMPKPWKSMFNAGAMVDVLNSGVQMHILWLKNELDFKYVRFWGIFPESVKFQQSNDFQFNFSRIDHAVNFLLQNGMKPFLQLGPKPRTLIGHTSVSVLNEFGSANPDDYNEENWQACIDSLMHHLVAEFGVSEIESWIFEMWCPCPWDKPWENWYTDEKYEILYRTVKKYSPETLVGGCEFERHIHAERMKKSATYWKERGIVPDFISFSFFLDDIKNSGDISKLEPITNMDYLLNEVRGMHHLLEKLEIKDAKLFISLWNMTISNQNILNDTCFKGAWIIKNMTDIAGLVDMAGYWLISDIYGTVNNPVPTLFGGAAVLTKDGICKPAFYAFQFFDSAMELLISKSENYCLTKDRHGNFALLFHNMQMLNIQPLLNNTRRTYTFGDLTYIFDTDGILKLRLTLRGITQGKYYIRKSSVSKKHGSVLDEREKWDTHIDLLRSDCEYLKKICMPAVDISVVEPDGDKLTLNLDVISNEFGLLEVILQY